MTSNRGPRTRARVLLGIALLSTALGCAPKPAAFYQAPPQGPDVAPFTTHIRFRLSSVFHVEGVSLRLDGAPVPLNGSPSAVAYLEGGADTLEWHGTVLRGRYHTVSKRTGGKECVGEPSY
jgi:hypothetical protein